MTSDPALPGPERNARTDASGGGAERDAETVGLIAEFLVESEEGLAKVDEILMRAEEEGAAEDSVDALFRVFHTIKGVAGFLELAEIAELAHTTETMLDGVRRGATELRGPVLDVALEASGLMHRLLGGVKLAVERRAAFPVTPTLPELLERIRAATAGESAATPAAAAADAAPPKDEAPLVGPAATRAGDEPRGAGDAAPAVRGPRLRETLKVDVERVDNLVDLIGELVILESMVVHSPEIAGLPSLRVRDYLSQLGGLTRDLQDLGMRMRMVPVRGVFQRMARMTRDLSRRSGKTVRLVTAGETTEMDRSMVERIAEPLVHMIRNAVDHGIEPPEERARAGKPPTGTIRLSARHEAGNIVIEVADDGRGLDRDVLVEKAVRTGLLAQGDGLSDADVFKLIFTPGFSTARQVTDVSGRGVGLDVVRRNVEALRGRIRIDSAPGRGTTFTMTLPLTLAIINGTLVRCGAEQYIVPTLSVLESFQPGPAALALLAGRHELVRVREETLPLVRLARLFRIPNAVTDLTAGLVVVVSGVGRRIGLFVDEVIAQQQIVIKALGSSLEPAPYVSGATILSDGRVGLILNVEEICALGEGRVPASPHAGGVSASRAASTAPVP